MRTTVLLLCTALTATGAPVPKDAKLSPELTQLQGRWKWETLSDGGKPFVIDFPGATSLEFERDVMIERSGKQVKYWRVKIDAKAKPAQMTATELAPPKPGDPEYVIAEKAKTEHFVYGLDGDTLTIARYESKPGVFPESLTPAPGTGVIVAGFKRKNDKE